MKTTEKLSILENEKKLAAIYLREFAEGKLTKKEYIETIARITYNTENMIG